MIQRGTMEINFSNIRPHDGSKQNGFEELVCQLAHLEKPSDAERFVRKEGAGGDAGVECYWALNDKSEICWQVKYFPDGMNPSRWKQIDESFRTALSKHQNLRKYVVCLPLDKADSRKTGRGGKIVTSVEDEWLTYTEKWEKAAKIKGRNIEFEFWGKHEITSYLLIDNPHYSGRALYWFDTPILGMQQLERISKRARESLGERYTPEFHIELPIISRFDGVCLNSAWREGIATRRISFDKESSTFFEKFINQSPSLLDQNKVKQLKTLYTYFRQNTSHWTKHDTCLPNLPETKNNLAKITKCHDEIYTSSEHLKAVREHKDGRELTSLFHSFSREATSFESFLESSQVKAEEATATVLYGDAGIGKSHLLCDLSLNRVRNNQPTIFLLGNQYGGGNPINFIKEALDLKNQRDSEVLGALDSLGEANRSRTVIVIDAINEGQNRDDWHSHITSFLSDLSYFKNVAIIFSCRTTYLRYILPDDIGEDRLVRIHHQGFQGYEHRAAEKYLSRQGISKPSAPILAPEFSNPLFLKTCCQAIKSAGLTTFPKGMQGVTSLFEFYIESIERTISRKKKYSSSEKIVFSALTDFASKTFPDFLNGIPIGEARNLINNYDPDPNRGNSLFDELIDEGILSEDISYTVDGSGKPVIRFTYERFSDHYVATQIAENHSAENIKTLFNTGQPLGDFVTSDRYYSLTGIFESLAIIIAEKYGHELADLLPVKSNFSIFEIEEMFINTIIWRSPSSITERTLELLNSLDKSQHSQSSLDILLKLATEPNHPWNAELLHRNLKKNGLAERDKLWSTYLAFGMSSEGDDGDESIVRTLIEWAYSGEINEIEPERIRLCCISLFWFLTTPNRAVRDRATKSLVRLLSIFPNFLSEFLANFGQINDPYLVERLYAIAFGVVSNIKDDGIITDIANIVYLNVFAEGQPVPHILLRDYARSVLELACHRNLLTSDIDQKCFRPPYRSDWPIENPTEEKIDQLSEGERSSRIKSSLMGFPGDFGNYTMNCVHNFSRTTLDQPRAQNGYEIKLEFAESLQGPILEEFLKKIEPKTTQDASAHANSLLPLKFQFSVITEDQEKNIKNKQNAEEDFRKRLVNEYGEEKMEHYRWLSGLGDERPAAFSRKWGQRWVCKRAYEFGWTSEYFSEFEYSCSHGRAQGPGSGAMERMGKKYQWMALHELLARMSDNLHWIDRGYSDLEDSRFYGPWQLGRRDLDPTIWARTSGEHKSFHNQEKTWWQSYDFELDQFTELDKKNEFLWDESIIPNFKELLQISDGNTQRSWTLLKGFWWQKQENSDDNDNEPCLDAWFRINTIFIEKGTIEELRTSLSDISITDPHLVEGPSTQHEGYLGEYPWGAIYKNISGWVEVDKTFHRTINQRYFVPYTKYEWESGSSDYSLDSSLSFYLPAKEIVEELNLERTKEDFASWSDENGVVFIDPSLKEYGPSFALMQSDTLKKWLNDHNLEIAWLIGGEKEMFSNQSMDFHGRCIYSGIFNLENNEIQGAVSFKHEKPQEEEDK